LWQQQPTHTRQQQQAITHRTRISCTNQKGNQIAQILQPKSNGDQAEILTTTQESLEWYYAAINFLEYSKGFLYLGFYFLQYVLY
jgi:hypothetical protein